MDRNALLAVPIPTKVRPGARAFSVAMELAVTAGMRVTGFVTQVPSLIVLVFLAARARYWYGSLNSNWPSPTPKWLAPTSSAWRASAT
jgi:hypothetical protein